MIYIVGTIIIVGLMFMALVLSILDKAKSKDEYIEPNEFMTLQDCLDLYYYDNRRFVIENGKITEII